MLTEKWFTEKLEQENLGKFIFDIEAVVRMFSLKKLF